MNNVFRLADPVYAMETYIFKVSVFTKLVKYARNTVIFSSFRVFNMGCPAHTRVQRLLLPASGSGNRLAWPHSRRGLASNGVRYAGARSSVGHRLRSVTKQRLEWCGGIFLLLQQRSKHLREMIVTAKASTSHFRVGR